MNTIQVGPAVQLGRLQHGTGVTLVTTAPGPPGQSAYELAVEEGFVGTELEWLASLEGADGLDGTNGTNGVDGTDGVDGADGREVELQKSATHVQWRYEGDPTWADLVPLADITGPAGTDGTNGTNGTNGVDGVDGREVELQKTATHVQWRYVGEAWANLIALADITGADGTDGTNGADGADGASAYEVAVANGFVGTEVEWLATLVGAPGTDGADGADGAAGADGATWHNGSGPPTGLEAPAGDYYLDDLSGDVYRNISAGTQYYSAFEATTPPTDTTVIGGPFTAGLEFYTSVDCTITKILWWQPTTGSPSTESRSGRLWNATTAAVVANAVSAAPVGSGWQELVFAAPVALTAGVRYRVGVYHASGRLARTFDYFDEGDLVDEILTVPNGANATGADQGSYSTSAGIAFPNQSFSNANYWLDVELALDADWVLIGNLMGPAGPAGADGADGTDGADGDTHVPDPSAQPDGKILVTASGALVYDDPPAGSGAVDSVNGQTGVVTLGAADVGAAPALGADDNYVTDAEKAALHTHSAVIAQGATAADARAAIGAGTGDGDVVGTGISAIVALTQAAYDALGTPDATTLYVING